MLIQILMIFVCYAAEYVERVLDPSVRYRSEALVTENRMYHGQKPVDDRLQYCKGYDGRSRVRDTVSWPYSCAVRVDMKFRNASGDECFGYGSGMMIGPCHVLTCAHNVYDQLDKWATNVVITPALDGVHAPFGVIPCSRFYVFSQWINVEKQDIALVILSRPIGYQTGWAGLCSVKAKQYLLSQLINITQYPADKTTGTMWTMEGSVSRVDDDHLYYPIDTWRGSSGSAIYVKQPIQQGYVPYVIGVHTNGGSEYNIGERLTFEMFEKLIGWMSASWDLSESIPRLLPANSVLARSLAEQGDPEAQYQMADFLKCYFVGCFDSIYNIVQLEEGNALEHMIRNGRMTLAIKLKIRDLLEKSAKQKHWKAVLMLSRIYAKEEVTTPQPSFALALMMKRKEEVTTPQSLSALALMMKSKEEVTTPQSLSALALMMRAKRR